MVAGKISNETFEEWNRETGAKRLPERVGGKRSAAKNASTSPTKRKRATAKTRASKKR
jgi:hypothetical protein